MKSFKDLDHATLKALGRRIDTPQIIQFMISRSEDVELRRLIASNDSVNPEILTYLSRDDDPKVRSAVAANAYTPPAVLRMLSDDESSIVVRALASNPQTPTDILDSFVRFAYREREITSINVWSLNKEKSVAELAAVNPSMPVAGLLSDVEAGLDKAKRYLACNRNSPAEVLQRLASDEDHEIVEAVASNPNTPVTMLLDLANSERSYAAFVAGNPSMTTEMLDSLTFWSADEALARNPNTPPRTLELKSTYLFSDTTNLIAANPSTPPGVLSRLAKKVDLTPSKDYTDGDRRRYMLNRVNVASNPSTPQVTLLTLAKDESPEIRAAVACNTSSSAKIVTLLANDPDADVREAALSNPVFNLLEHIGIASLAEHEIAHWAEADFGFEDLLGSYDAIVGEFETISAIAARGDAPEAFLKWVLDNGDAQMRSIVAGNNSIGSNIVKKLARDVSPLVRKVIAGRQGLDEHIHRSLLGDRDEDVRRAACNNPVSTLSEDSNFNTVSDQQIRSLASNINTDQSTLRAILKKSEDAIALHALARNPSSPIDVLRDLYERGSSFYRSLAANPSTPIEILDFLSQEKGGDIRSALLGNPSTSANTLQSLAEVSRDLRSKTFIAKNPSTPPSTLEAYANGDSASLKKAVSSNVNVPDALAESLSKDSCPIIRGAIARNPSISLELLTLLASDSEPWVRSCVACNRNADIDTLRSLAMDPSSPVRMEARRALVAHGASVRMSTDTTDALVDIAIAKSANTGRDNLLILATRSNPLARIIAKTNDNLPLQDLLSRLCVPWDFADSKAKSEERRPSENLASFDVDNLFELDDEILIALAKRTDTPDEVFEALINTDNPEVLSAIASNPNSPCNLLTQLANSMDEQIINALGDNESLPQEALSALLSRPRKQLGEFFLSSIARRESTEPESLRLIAKNALGWETGAIASNPNTPQDVLVDWSESEAWGRRADVGKNPSTPIDVLWRLADDPNPEVRSRVASNPNLPEELITKLFSESAAGSLKFSQECKKWLAVNGSSYARFLLAGSFFTSPEALALLADNENYEVQQALLCNQKTPDEIKNQLKLAGVEGKPNGAFAERKELERKANPYSDIMKEPFFALARNPRTPEQIIRYISEVDDTFIRPSVASHPNLPVDILEGFFQSDAPVERAALASSERVSPDMLATLAEDKSDLVRIAVARNETTPTKILIDLSNDKEIEVSLAAITNTSLTGSDLLQILEEEPYWARETVADNPNITSSIIARMAEDADEVVRVKAASSPIIDGETLEKLMLDQSKLVRMAVAANQTASSDVIKVLVTDAEHDVRVLALANASFDLLGYINYCSKD